MRYLYFSLWKLNFYNSGCQWFLLRNNGFLNRGGGVHFTKENYDSFSIVDQITRFKGWYLEPGIQFYLNSWSLEITTIDPLMQYTGGDSTNLCYYTGRDSTNLWYYTGRDSTNLWYYTGRDSTNLWYYTGRGFNLYTKHKPLVLYCLNPYPS